MHSHIDKDEKVAKHQKAYNFLDKHLPNEYTEKTQEVLLKVKIEVSDAVIRNVRNKRTTTNIDVLNALLKVAKQNQRAKDQLEEALQ